MNAFGGSVDVGVVEDVEDVGGEEFARGDGELCLT